MYAPIRPGAFGGYSHGRVALLLAEPTQTNANRPIEPKKRGGQRDLKLSIVERVLVSNRVRRFVTPDSVYPEDGARCPA